MTATRLSLMRCTKAGAILWGGCFLLVALANRLFPPYGFEFLKVIDSIYPGYHAYPSFVQTGIGTLYALVDGAIGGLLWGLLYNCCGCTKCEPEQKA